MHPSDAPLSPRSAATSPRFPFRLKLALAGGLLALIPLAIAGTLLLNVNADAIRTHARELQLSVAEDITMQVDGTFRSAQDGLETVARVLVDTSLDPTATESLATAVVSGSEELSAVGVYAADGTIIDVIAEEESELRLPDEIDPSLRQQAERNGVASGEVTHENGKNVVLVLVPLRVRETVTGYAAAPLTLSNVSARIRRVIETRFQGQAQTVYVVDERHRQIADGSSVEAPPTPPLASGALAGIAPGTIHGRFEQSGEYDVSGQAMVGTIIGLPSRPWAVVVQLPRDEVYASYARMRLIVLTTLSVVLLLALIAAFVVARQITKPIDELTLFAKDLALRKFDKRIRVGTRDELSMLGDVMSSAAASLEESESRIRTEVAIRTDLGRYLAAEVVDAVVAREQDMALGGTRQEITVLFADVVGFTPLTEKLSAEVVVKLLNELFTILTEIVFRHQGTIDKFVGDCVMAMWGAPKHTPEHASRALRAAEDMMKWLEIGNETWRAKYGVTIELAIGVNTGSAIVGNIGSSTRMEFTAIGDAVNIAARLEAIARPMQILVSQAVVDQAGDEFTLRDIGLQNLVGRKDPVHLWEVEL